MTVVDRSSGPPELDAKVRDIVGLYLDPPDKAVVVCIDEKSQIQALDRTAPILPMRPGLPAKATHDYVRHGTTTLFAALEVATGKVTDACYDRHRHQEFLAFLKVVAKGPSPGQAPRRVRQLRHPQARSGQGVASQAPPDHPALHAHLGLMAEHGEIFFGIITRQAIRRGTFTSVDDLKAAIEQFIDGWNQRCAPFVWTKTAGGDPQPQQKSENVIQATLGAPSRGTVVADVYQLCRAGPGSKLHDEDVRWEQLAARRWTNFDGSPDPSVGG